MARSAKPPEPPPLALKQPHDVARTRLQERIDKGRQLHGRQVNTGEEAEAFNKEYEKWDDYNGTLLDSLFTNDSLVTEYNWSVSMGLIAYDETMGHKYRRNLEHLSKKIDQLESIFERIELIPLAPGVATSQQARSASPSTPSDRVFIVHGHDAAGLEMVARFIERVGLSPVVLHEQPSGGRTVIEKLEHHADVGFAVILLTPDDEGKAKGNAELKPRARQNVVLELGYFVGHLGRHRVCALHRGPIELPSDILGVVYVAFDEGGGWRLPLARELKQAGFNIDMNRAM